MVTEIINLFPKPLPFPALTNGNHWMAMAPPARHCYAEALLLRSTFLPLKSVHTAFFISCLSEFHHVSRRDYRDLACKPLSN